MLAAIRNGSRFQRKAIEKVPSGISGLDEMTGGGLPRGRTTLLCGSAGCGKTLFSTEFLVRGALDYGEPGVFVSFEETSDDLVKNVASLGFDLEKLIASRQLLIDQVRVGREEIAETGEYDLDGFFVRLGFAIDSVKARRVVLDSLEALFAELPNHGLLRAEIRRLFLWLKDKGVTSIVTAERDHPERLTRHGLEEFVSDCVILLDHRVRDEVSTRRLRIVKYRGSHHGTNEYPFLIDQDGISVMPISALHLNHAVGTERVSTGIAGLDSMLGGKGYYRGSSILVSGTAGTGKSSVAGSFANAVCARGQRCLYLAFEESPQQILRNMKSIGLDLGRWVKRGRLQFHAARPTFGGLEYHLVTAHKLVRKLDPAAVVIDPISNLGAVGADPEVQSMLTRLIDYLKSRGITALFTTLSHADKALEFSAVGVSSLMDTWLLLKMMEIAGERNRVIYLLKSRGMAHSNQVREFVMTSEGICLTELYLGQEGVLTGSLRRVQEARDRAQALLLSQQIESGRRRLQRQRLMFEAQMRQLRSEYQAKEEEIMAEVKRLQLLVRESAQNRVEMARVRGLKALRNGPS